MEFKQNNLNPVYIELRSKLDYSIKNGGIHLFQYPVGTGKTQNILKLIENMDKVIYLTKRKELMREKLSEFNIRGLHFVGKTDKCNKSYKYLFEAGLQNTYHICKICGDTNICEYYLNLEEIKKNPEMSLYMSSVYLKYKFFLEKFAEGKDILIIDESIETIFADSFIFDKEGLDWIKNLIMNATIRDTK